MYKIAICDDDKNYREKIEKVIETEGILPKSEIRFYEYESGKELLENADILHDLVFMDMRMPGLDGNKSVLKLREYNRAAILVFCSGYFEPTPDSINIGQPFRYIMKDLHDRSLKREIPAILSKVKLHCGDYSVTVTSAGRVIRIYTEDILYICLAKRGCSIYVARQGEIDEMQNIEDCCVVYNQSIGKGVLIAFIKNKISSISYTKEEYRKQLAFFLPPAMIPSEFVNVERFPLSTNGKIDRKGLAESIQKNIKVKHNAKATLISQKKEYVELAKSIKKIVCSISGNDYIDYEDNLLENGLDSLLLSQISGRIVSDIQEAQGMRFDEILRASLTMPTIMGIAQYISDCKNPSKNQMHSNAGNQTRNSYTVVYIFGDNENEIRDVLIEKLSASNISCKRVGGQEIIERCHEDISVKKKYIIAFSEMASLCITKASELLGENIIINRIFLINPSKAKESDLYLGDISIIDGNSVAIKSWEKAVLGNVREFESNSNDIFDIIMRELENDK